MFRIKTEALQGYLTYYLKKCSIWFEKLILRFLFGFLLVKTIDVCIFEL